MAAVQAAEIHGDKWGLTSYLNERYIQPFQPELTHKIH